jgi:site-specific DNA-cytosine methylase
VNVIVACEFSGVVRDAFNRAGHTAVSVDLEPSETPGPHIQADILQMLDNGGAAWADLLIAFPPCTDLSSSGARWFAEKGPKRQLDAIMFVRALMAARVPRIAVENPIGILSSVIAKPTQIIQPWEFGHGERKATCLWLTNLPPLRPTNIVDGREPKVHYMSPGPNRGRERSRTYTGIAEAMAAQWGDVTNG